MIVVFGALGSIGSHLVKELSKSGHRVRATCRDQNRGKEMFSGHAGVEVMNADIEKEETLHPVLEGATKVFVSVGGARCGADLDVIEKRFIDIVKTKRGGPSSIDHYVKISGIDSRPDATTDIQKIHGAIEVHLRGSGVPYTILKPCFFMQNFLGLAPAIKAGVLPMPTGDAKGSIIDARDIADVAHRVLTSTTEQHRNQLYTLTGPESLSHSDAAEIFTRVLEHQVTFQNLPAEAWEKSLVEAGLPGWFAHRLTDVYANLFAQGGVSRVTDDIERVIGRKPRSLATFIRDHVVAFR
jgi:uncharacterized protein YbjT (DUF2867 family)